MPQSYLRPINSKSGLDTASDNGGQTVCCNLVVMLRLRNRWHFTFEFFVRFLVDNLQAIVRNTSNDGALAAEQLFLISFEHSPAPTRQTSKDHEHHIELVCPVNGQDSHQGKCSAAKIMCSPEVNDTARGGR
jgi:hypothetical protein